MKVNCLIIDDEPLAINVIKNHIELIENFELINTFSNSIEGLNFLKNNAIDVVFLDINMPKMDGWEFMEEYREMKVERQRAKVILLTTSENPDDIEKAGKYPEIYGYCNKPLTKEIISNLMNRYYPE